MSKTYTYKPVEIEAVQWTGYNLDEVVDFVNKKCGLFKYRDHNRVVDLYIDMLDSIVVVKAGDYIWRRI